LAHRLVGERVDVSQLDHPPRQQAQRPAPVPLGWLGTRRGDEVGLLLAVELGGIDPLAAAVWAQRRRQALLDEALADARHGREAHPDRLGDAPVTPGRPACGFIGLEQDLGVLELAHVGLAAREQPPELRALRRRQRHPIPLHRQPPAVPT
jgi:hypothetical protein